MVHQTEGEMEHLSSSCTASSSGVGVGIAIFGPAALMKSCLRTAVVGAGKAAGGNASVFNTSFNMELKTSHCCAHAPMLESCAACTCNGAAAASKMVMRSGACVNRSTRKSDCAPSVSQIDFLMAMVYKDGR